MPDVNGGKLSETQHGTLSPVGDPLDVSYDLSLFQQGKHPLHLAMLVKVLAYVGSQEPSNEEKLTLALTALIVLSWD